MEKNNGKLTSDVVKGTSDLNTEGNSDLATKASRKQIDMLNMWRQSRQTYRYQAPWDQTGNRAADDSKNNIGWNEKAANTHW